MTTQPIKLDNKETVLQFLDSYDTFLFDCDGVLWSGTHLLPNVIETLSLLKKLNKTVLFVTNNSTKSRQDYTKKFANFGIENVTKDQIFSSSFATAIYMKNFSSLDPKTDKIWVFGESGIEKELQEVGFTTLGGSDPRLSEEWDQQKTPFLPCDPSVKAVVAGLDTKINFHRLCVTFNYLKQDDVKYVATNIDTTFPGKPYLQPGCGSMIELLTKSSGRPEPPNCGKPSQLMLDTVFEAFPNLKREKCCMIGDRLNTDIKFGIDGKLGGQLLVLSGVEKESCLSDKTHGFELPKYYADKLGDVYEHYSK
jgi:4-nitrophenyl phosphatase